MRSGLLRLTRRLLRRANFALISYDQYQSLIDYQRDVAAVVRMPAETLQSLGAVAARSMSQLGQDLFALCESGFKTGGYFVEFGATNGVDLSNTYLLEKAFGWTGILAEPAECWKAALRANRNCEVDERCVWAESDCTVAFNETASGELSTIDSFSSTDMHRRSRKHGRVYSVKTVSLVDLLRQHGAPADIDYLSIDTEGSEFQILSTFDFDRYRIRTITCEHNYTSTRGQVTKLLSKHGYKCKYPGLSRWDAWYVRE